MTTDDYDRYLAIRRRCLGIGLLALRPLFEGATVLVTGGTGQVGSCLLPLLLALRAAPLVSVSRGVTAPTRVVDGVHYLQADVRNADQVADVVDRHRPEVVFHLAGQRDPGWAERHIAETVATNVLGTVNVLRACAGGPVRSFVYASTGKAVLLFTPGVYASSKKVAECLVADAWRPASAQVGIARFTHIVDNSILLRRIGGWMSAGHPIRLHGPHIHFYAQSAVESAELLLACAAPRDYRPPTVSAIRDLGWPVGLVDLTHGALARHGSRVPVTFVGLEQGYDDGYPGLYDPLTAGDHSPLINAIEASRLVSAGGTIESFAAGCASRPLAPHVAPHAEALLASSAGTAPATTIRRELQVLCCEVLRREVTAADPEVVERMVKRAGDPASMPEAHRVIHDKLCSVLGRPPAEAGA